MTITPKDPHDPTIMSATCNPVMSSPCVPGITPDSDTVVLANPNIMRTMTSPAMTASLRTTVAPAPAAFFACIAWTNTPTAASKTMIASTR